MTSDDINNFPKKDYKNVVQKKINFQIQTR